MTEVRPSQRMREIGIVQHGATILAEPARPFALPAERDAAQHVLARLHAAMELISQAHDFSGKGMGLAAPQLDIPCSAAVVRPTPDTEPVILLNPRVTAASEETDEQYEGCLSYFDVRGMVPRPLRITVESSGLDGHTTTTVYERGLARLIAHEIDHLDGLLYTSRMRPDVTPIPIEEYRQTGRAWAYE